MKSYLTGYMAMVIILFDAVADSSYLSNRGLPFFILLGLIAQSGIQKRGSIHFVNNLKQ